VGRVKGRGRESGEGRGGTFSPRTLESKSAPFKVPVKVEHPADDHLFSDTIGYK
jgi:hypothetical protein